MTSLSEHQLLVFFLQLVVLVGVARGLGGLLRRAGQPAVVGELAAGLLLGPSVLGRVAPGLFGFLFPFDDPVQTGLLLAVSWIGVALLLVATGFETDLELLRRLGRSSALVAAGSIVVPLVVAFGFATLLPASFVGPEATRTTFAMFIAVSLSISALAVMAKILGDLELLRRNVGQVSLAAAMANDLTGWILLGTVAGIVHEGGFDPLGVAATVAAIAVFLAAMLTLGQRLSDTALRRVRQGSGGVPAGLTVTIGIAMAAGVVTQLIGVEAVLGAFVAGIVLGRSRYQSDEVRTALESMTAAFFAPVFFATAGLRVDLGLLARDGAAWWALAAIALAVGAKTAGAFAGGRLGGLPARENLAVAVGLNARGTLEIVVATVALSLGVFTPVSYTVVIVLAMTTSMTTPPVLRRVLSRMEAGPEEAARLEREAVLDASVIANTRTALLPTRGGANSLLAARLLDASLQADTTVAICTVGADGDGAMNSGDDAAREAAARFADRATERITAVAPDAAAAICAEAALGYGLVAVGMNEGFSGGHTISTTLRGLLSACPVPLLLVKAGRDLDPDADGLPFRRIMVPATGTKVGQAAQEVAYTLAERLDAGVDVVHVVSRPDRLPEPAMVGAAGDTVVGMLAEAQTLASKFGRDVNPLTRNGPSVGMELAITAHETGADLLVLGAKVRSYSGQPFLGHGIEYLLEHAEQTVVVVVFPAQLADGE